MRTFSRRTFIKSTMLVGAGLTVRPRRARAAEFQYRLATDAPNGHPLNDRLQQAAAEIRTRSNGALDIQVFPNNQLGGSTDMLSQIRAGGIEFLSIPTSILSVRVPAAAICGVGFAFKDYDTVWKAMDGDLGAHIRTQAEKVHLIAMDKIFDNGFRQITTSSKPILSPADLDNLKIRVPPSQLSTSLFKSLKAAPTSINFAELYSALQTKIVEGQENALPIINAGKLYEVQKFCSITNHMWDGYWIVANEKAFTSLPADLQTIVRQAFDKAAMAERSDILNLNETLRPSLEKNGLTFATPETDGFRKVLASAGFYSEWKKTFGAEAWAALEQYTGALA